MRNVCFIFHAFNTKITFNRITKLFKKYTTPNWILKKRAFNLQRQKLHENHPYKRHDKALNFGESFQKLFTQKFIHSF